MDEQNKPTIRKKKILGPGKGVEKKGEGLGTGPVGQTGRPTSAQSGQNAQQPSPNFTRPSAQKPQNPFGQITHGSFGQNAQRPAQDPFSRPSQNSSAQQRPAQDPFSRPAQNSSAQQQRPQQGSYGAQRPQQHQHAQKQSSVSFGQRQDSQQRAGTGSFGGGKLLLPIILIVVALLFGKNLFGGESGNNLLNSLTGGSGNGNSILSSVLGSQGSSPYDFMGMISGLGGGGNISGSDSTYFTSSLENNTQEPDQTVSTKAREKYTVLKGGKKDTMTIMVYMCGADLESQNGMATADLKEMANANLGDNVNLIVFTGGARRWRNNVVDSRVNQVYQIKDGKLIQLVADGGTASMTNPNTLAEYIQFGAKEFPANRMVLIFWDHGGGSISGYGYDERYGQGQTMTLSGINEALKKGGVKFDFIGFDTCLMATVENGLMLNQYADYMIASEETEPGVGWYYTNWLNKVGANPSMSTVQIGKIIVDDFVEVCSKSCRGQATTLSVVDLAELSATVPAELTQFSVSTNDLIQNKQYKKVSAARSKSREFASNSKIDQIDLVHFARNLGTPEGGKLADAVQGAVKYNRTGGGISDAYGLSIYFPYKKTGKVGQMVNTYKAIGMDAEYTRCIQEFASLEVSGQLSAGTSPESYGISSSAPSGLMDSLFGNSNYLGSIADNYTGGGLGSLLGGYYGGGSSSGSTGSILDLLAGREMNAEKAADYILENHLDPSALVWDKNGRITLTDEQWNFVSVTEKNVFYDDGEGFIDLGFDPLILREGNDLVYEFDGHWLSIDYQPVAYYQTGLVSQGDYSIEIGYAPAIVNGQRADVILVFDYENPEGYIAGAEYVYPGGETNAQAKNMISIGKGTQIQFICDYYSYDGKYIDSYKLGNPIILGDTVSIGYTEIDLSKCRVTYRLTDYYQQQYWTPAVLYR